MKYLYFFSGFLFLFLLSGCEEENKSSSVYVGAYQGLDQVIPYPYLLHKTKDTVFLLNHKAKRIGYGKNEKINENDTLFLGNNHFNIIRKRKDKLLVFNLSDTINFRRYKDGYPFYKDIAFFVKASSVTFSAPKEKFQKEIANSLWKYEVIEDENTNPNNDFKIEKLYSFQQEKIIQLTNYYYQKQLITSEYQELNYHIFKVDNYLFLSFEKDEENPQPIFQITAINKNEIQLKDLSAREPKDITFSKSKTITQAGLNDLILKSRSYSNCFDGHQGEYYHDDITFNKGNEFLVDYVNKNAPLNEAKQSGYIIVHFNINCKGNIGDFGLIQMTRDYKSMAFSEELIKYIVSKVTELHDWPSFVSSGWTKYKDVHAFLMFKLNEGKIVDLCP